MAVLATTEELIRWTLPASVFCVFMLFSPALREKTLKFKALYVLAVLGVSLLTNVLIKWLIAAGYEQAYHNSVILLIWLGPVLLFWSLARREWQYGTALLSEKCSPITGWDKRYDNIERNEEEAVAYGKSRHEMAAAMYVIAAVWFLGGIAMYVA